MGRLSRKKVMTLISNDVENPSDIKRLLYCKTDDARAWELKLAKELKGQDFQPT
jgi:predicted nucleotide-binding protein